MTREEINKLPCIAQLYINDLQRKIEKIKENIPTKVYVVTERDNYGEQLFRGVFANIEKAVEHFAKDGLKESNVYEINEIELD
jgi:hypothetical protein